MKIELDLISGHVEEFLFARVSKQDYEKMSRGGHASFSLREKWAVCVNMSVNKKLAASAANQCIGVAICIGERVSETCVASGQRKTVFTPYIIAEKVRTTLRLVPCKFTDRKNVAVAVAGKGVSGQNGQTIDIEMPLEFKSSHSVLASCFDSLRAGSKVSVFAFGLTGFGNSQSGCIWRAAVGLKSKLLDLQEPTPSFCKRAEPQTSQKAPTQQCQVQQESDDGPEDDDSDDAAALGFDLLLEHVQEECQQQQDSGEDSEGPDVSMFADARPESAVLEQFCGDEMRDGAGGNHDDGLEIASEAFATEVAAATDEHVAIRAEANIVKEVHRSLANAAMNFKVKLEGEDDSLESVFGPGDEALLRHACGNDQAIGNPGPAAFDSCAWIRVLQYCWML